MLLHTPGGLEAISFGSTGWDRLAYVWSLGAAVEFLREGGIIARPSALHRARQQQHRQTQLLPPSLPAICLPLARPEERAVVKGARDGTVGITPRFHLNLLSVCLICSVYLFISLQQYYPSLLSIIASIPSDVLSSTASPPHIR